MVDLRQPNLSGNDHEILMGIKTYLFQLREQLQWAFDNLETSSGISDTILKNTVVNNSTIVNSSAVPSGSAEAEATYNAIKGFIIKSADVANAYYDIVSKRLEGSYAAKSDYGDFVTQTLNEIQATSEKIDQNYTSISAIIENKVGETKDEIKGDIQEVTDGLEAFTRIISQEGGDASKMIYIGTEALIRSGLLDENNGVPIYGIEVGQRVFDVTGNTVFKASAQFRPDKLVFFTSNGEVSAYIGAQKFYINQGEINDNLKMGGLVDRVITEGDLIGDIVTTWEG